MYLRQLVRHEGMENIIKKILSILKVSKTRNNSKIKRGFPTTWSRGLGTAGSLEKNGDVLVAVRINFV